MKRARAAGAFADYAFLHDWAMVQLQDRLADIKRDFERCVQIGGRGPTLDGAFSMDLVPGYGTDVIGDEEFLPFANGSLDMVFSNLALHSVNDLPGALIQIRRALKSDGLFIASMLGGETLWQLREVMMEAEMEIYGGVSPRVLPFADKQQMGGLLQRAGFALPVVDSHIVTVTYENVRKLMHDLRGMGESSIIEDRMKTCMRRDYLARVEALYTQRYAEGDERIPASFDVIFLLGWSPHDSQQKPLKPGSAKVSLADALHTKETKL